MMLTLLTTIDNPYDPFDEPDDWFNWDTTHGYHTSAFLARIVVLSDEQSEADQAFAVKLAVDEIVRENVNGMYKKVEREVADSTIQVPSAS